MSSLPLPPFIPRDARMARFLPSNVQLPSCWTKEMDCFICQCEALADVDTATIIFGLKNKFADILGNVCIVPEAVERRIQALELMDNDYFVAGMRAGVKRAEDNGFIMPPMDFEKYSKKKESDDGDCDGASRRTRGRNDQQGTGGVKSAFKRISGDLLISAKLRAANNSSQSNYGTSYQQEVPHGYYGKQSVEAPANFKSSTNSGGWAGFRGRGKENNKYSLTDYETDVEAQ